MIGTVMCATTHLPHMLINNNATLMMFSYFFVPTGVACLCAMYQLCHVFPEYVYLGKLVTPTVFPYVTAFDGLLSIHPVYI